MSPRYIKYVINNETILLHASVLIFPGNKRRTRMHTHTHDHYNTACRAVSPKRHIQQYSCIIRTHI